MKKIKDDTPIYLILIIVIINFFGCSTGLPIEYSLTKKNTVLPISTQSLSVFVTTFSDKRPQEERKEEVRKQLKYEDIDDYTYDEEFKGEVNEGISKMIIRHLEYSKIFRIVTYAKGLDDQLSESQFEGLRKSGFDAVLMGSIDHFYGYYDRNVGREWIYGLGLTIPAVVIGVNILENNPSLIESPMGGQFVGYIVGIPIALIGQAIENLHPRDIGWYTQLSAQLVSTSTYDILWKDTLTSYNKDRAPGKFSFSGDSKYNLALESLRDAVNQMVKSLSEIPLKPE